MSSIQIGKLTDEEMKRFNLGPYSKKWQKFFNIAKLLW
jgi:hypothetical protein